MTQPKFAPIAIEDEVRPSYRLATPRPWSPTRPADFGSGTSPSGIGAGTPGPDQGYALRLARRFAGRLVLTEEEHEDDALAGAVVIALRRAAAFGRAPVLADLEFALGLFGYLGEAPSDLVDERRRLFRGAAHDYWDRRTLAASVPDDVLCCSPAEVRTSLESWRDHLAASS